MAKIYNKSLNYEREYTIGLNRRALGQIKYNPRETIRINLIPIFVILDWL